MLLSAWSVATGEPAPSLLVDDGLGGSAGYDKGFVIRDETGANTLRLNMQMQFRYIWNQRTDESAPGANDEVSQGFHMRRTRLKLSGTAFSKQLGYKIVTGYKSLLHSPVVLLDAYGTYTFDGAWRLKWGQYKPMLLREYNVSSSKQFAVERSVTTFSFTQGRSIGVEASGSWDRLRTWLGVTQGGRVTLTGLGLSNRPDLAFDARGEWLFAGEAGGWKRFGDLTSFREQPFAAMAGAAVHYEFGGNTNGSDDIDVLWFSADTSLEGDGWNAMAQYVGRYTDEAGTLTTFDQGVTVQAGVFVADQTEIYGRWSAVFPGDRPTGDKVFNSVTAGANYYFIPESHALKLSGDVSVFLDEVSGNSLIPPGSSIGALPDLGEGQFVVRLQMQMLF